MKFLLAIYGNEEMWGSLSKEEFDALIAEHGAFEQEVRESGELVSVEGLSDAVNARTVRVRDGVPVVTDGPYLESKEYLASFFILDCENLERAVELAARYPAARRHGVEVWPLLEDGGSDAGQSATRSRACCASWRRRSSACSSAATGSSTCARTRSKRRSWPRPCSGPRRASRPTRGAGC
jgi:hypothetical protein